MDIYKGKYKIWYDGHLYRWALDQWPDDGFGLQSHGGCTEYWQAKQACKEHMRLKELLAADRDKR